MKKICTKCKNEKELEEFSDHPKGKFKKHPRCNTCRSLYAREKYKNSDKRIQKRQYTYSQQLKYCYGMSLQDYENLVVLQEGKCAICKCDKKLVVDHNHTTGVVRGLLCTTCNTGLGKFKDDPELINQAKIYLENKSARADLPC